MTLEDQGIDQAGDEVLKFISAARNYTRVGELVDEIGRIAKSDVWRRYQTATGTNEWREAEFDYFLIACDLPYEDVARVISYSQEQETLAKLMDRDADLSRRRPLAEAAEAWRSGSVETLLDRARRLNWLKKTGSSHRRAGFRPGDALRVTPLPQRFRARQREGLSQEEKTRQKRSERLDAARREELEKLAAEVQRSLANDLERRFFMDQLREPLRKQSSTP